MRYILKNANIIPMNKEGLLEGYSILIEDCRIKKIAKAIDEKVTKEIDCTGKYIIPGLFDMHVHINTSDMIDLFLANGVTGIRNMWGFPIQLEWKAQIDAGLKFGPRIFSTGPLHDGVSYWEGTSLIETPERAEACVREDKAKGYDFIKTYPSIPKDAFLKIMEVANEQNIKVVGHGNQFCTSDELIELGYHCIEHTNCLPQDKDEVKRMAESGMWFCPTQEVVWTIWDYVINDSDMTKIPYYEYVNKLDRKFWDEITVWRKSKKDDKKRRFDMEEVKERGKTFVNNSENILLGTDTNNPGVVAGFSIHFELKRMMDDFGMSAYESIRTGTYHAARHLQVLDDLGTVEEGKYADILVLEANPLENIENTANINSVIKDGTIYDREFLDNKLEEIKNLKEEDLVIVYGN